MEGFTKSALVQLGFLDQDVTQGNVMEHAVT